MTSAPSTPYGGGGSAAGLAAVDVVYVVRRVIRPVYLLDAAAELVLMAGWAVGWARHGGMS
ncbi:MAG: hypothetical protein JWO31_2890 [Phycisphaerales bacterium]|nr:hypothetical protein [Phycisphaerales bacterium]